MFKFLKNKSISPDKQCKELDKGVVKCENCKKEIPLNKSNSLSFNACPNCKCFNFVPEKFINYWILAPIGGGGVGHVFKAINRDTKELCALKFIKSGSNVETKSINHLEYEFKLSKLFSDSSDICKVYEYGTFEGRHYMVMELIKGKRLDLLIIGDNVFSEIIILNWIYKLSNVLNFIYKAGYLYRDIKPQNIIISDDYKNIKLFDFGLTRRIDSALRGFEEIEGSPEFNISPERAHCEPEGIPSEIYGLGMLMYYCFARKTFYTASTVNELVDLHKGSLRVGKINTKLNFVSEDVCNIIEKMVCYDKNKRYQTFEALNNDIEKLLLKE